MKTLVKEISNRNKIYKQNLRLRITDSEKIVLKIFKGKKISYKFQKGFYTIKGKHKGYHCIVDFYIPALHLAIEIDGGYHLSDKQKRKDTFKDKWLLKRRMVRMLRIKNKNASKVIEKINQFIVKRNSGKYRKQARLYWQRFI